MFAATRVVRQAAAHAERTPMIKFLGKRSLPSSVDHAVQPHPASPSHRLPDNFGKSSGKSSSPSSSFSSYRQQAQQHGPLQKSFGREAGVGALSGLDLGPVAPAKGEFFDRSELGSHFARTPYTEAEIEAIESGGATIVW